MSKPAPVIPALSNESRLKRKIRGHLHSLGYEKNTLGTFVLPTDQKDSIRAAHSLHRLDVLRKNSRFVDREYRRLKHYFAHGDEVVPELVTPRLELVKAGTWQSNLFRLASLTWSVPVSSGFGRRLRYLVWDQSNGKAMGIIALGDPVFNLKARDSYIGWDAEARRRRLVYVLDAYVLGALPPYNSLLCGKLVACLVRSAEVRRDFETKYGASVGIISREYKSPKLVMVTTSSALGRSSVYNRLQLEGETYFRSVGYTQGWGHFHCSDELFEELRGYLRQSGHKYVDAHRYGDGPNWRMRIIRAAFDALGLGGNLLRHGIRRETFVSKLAANAGEILRGDETIPNFRNLKSVVDIGELAKSRWVIPRSKRRPDFIEWRADKIGEFISISQIYAREPNKRGLFA